MAVRSTPPITFADLRAEFGGGVGNDLGDYVRGGAFVPDGPAANAGIPTSPPLSLGDFYGAVNQQVTLTNRTIIQPFPGRAEFFLYTDGTTGPAKANEYLLATGAGAGAAYEARATVWFGSGFNGSALNTWLNLGTQRSWWTQQQTITGLTIEIRPAGGGAVLASANITFDQAPI